MTAQLIRAADGYHLWSQTYDHPLDDAIVLEEDVALQIADDLHAAIVAAQTDEPSFSDSREVEQVP